jgi:hypothetical protein
VRTAATLLAAGLALAPFAAEAQSYRCTGTDGKKYYGQSVPTQCIGMPVEVLNSQGMVTKRFDAAASAAERDKKAAEEEERKKREAITKEEGRRNRALLATYTSEKEIDNARARALQENQLAVKDVEGKIAMLRKRRTDLGKELDFYQGKNKPPAKLGQDIKDTEVDITAQEGLLAAKKKEVDSINTKYDEDKKRYGELTGLDMRERASRTGEAQTLVIQNRTDAKAVAARDQREAESRSRRDQYELQRLEAERSRGSSRSTYSGPSERGVGSVGSGTRTIMCGGTRIVCDPRDTVMCGGRAVACQ